jgi:hypothetical protein
MLELELLNKFNFNLSCTNEYLKILFYINMKVT